MASDDASSFGDLLDAISTSAKEVVSLARAPPAGSPAQALLFQLASLVERVPPTLRQLLLHEDDGVALPRSVAESLQAPLRRLRMLVEDATSSGRTPTAPTLSIEGAASELGRHLGLVLLAAGDAPADVREAAALLQRELMAVRVHPPLSSPQANPGQWGSSPTGDGVAPDLEDLLVRVKGASEEEELAGALEDLDYLIGGGVVWEGGGGIVAALLKRLRFAGKENRLRIILLLRSLASQSDDHKVRTWHVFFVFSDLPSILILLPYLLTDSLGAQYSVWRLKVHVSCSVVDFLIVFASLQENMADAGSLSTIVRSLTRDSEESRKAVRLLLDLAVIPRARQRMGKVQGCIVMLVTFLNGEDHCVSSDARKLLDALSSNTQNVLLMAEAGYFNPLVQYLKRGSDMNKILMATALSRIELSEQMKAVLGDEGSIEPLVKMFTSGKLEAKLSSLAAIRKLCTLKENVERLINSGIISHLLQLLFSVTSVLMTLREPAAAILACLAQSEIFRVEDHRGKYGAAAQVLLIDLAQKGGPTLKRMIAKVLAHLQLLPVQSSYF
ncbi:hypothetical protein Taro_035256 [Colocasia esculenta]|uniref:ARM repeat superfamily protein n=1 Tax=Colocasia esculenta TaxID=4460 RepID=A0A843VYJ1_COLES|nr:hypothetical protein [Colocasia esculenta]